MVKLDFDKQNKDIIEVFTIKDEIKNTKKIKCYRIINKNDIINYLQDQYNKYIDYKFIKKEINDYER